MEQKLQIDEQTILDSATEVKCPNPDCDSNTFFPTTYVKKVSALMTGQGKPGIVTLTGPLLCVKCHRNLADADFGYKKEDSEKNDGEEKDEEVYTG